MSNLENNKNIVNEQVREIGDLESDELLSEKKELSNVLLKEHSIFLFDNQKLYEELVKKTEYVHEAMNGKYISDFSSHYDYVITADASFNEKLVKYFNEVLRSDKDNNLVKYKNAIKDIWHDLYVSKYLSLAVCDKRFETYDYNVNSTRWKHDIGISGFCDLTRDMLAKDLINLNDLYDLVTNTDMLVEKYQDRYKVDVLSVLCDDYSNIRPIQNKSVQTNMHLLEAKYALWSDILWIFNNKEYLVDRRGEVKQFVNRLLKEQLGGGQKFNPEDLVDPTKYSENSYSLFDLAYNSYFINNFYKEKFGDDLLEDSGLINKLSYFSDLDFDKEDRLKMLRIYKENLYRVFKWNLSWHEGVYDILERGFAEYPNMIELVNKFVVNEVTYNTYLDLYENNVVGKINLNWLIDKKNKVGNKKILIESIRGYIRKMF